MEEKKSLSSSRQASRRLSARQLVLKCKKERFVCLSRRLGDSRRADYREWEVSSGSDEIHSVLIHTTERTLTVGGSGSSRWQRSRSHFVQTNNTAVCLPLLLPVSRHTRKSIAIRQSRPIRSRDTSSAPRAHPFAAVSAYSLCTHSGDGWTAGKKQKRTALISRARTEACSEHCVLNGQTEGYITVERLG